MKSILRGEAGGVAMMMVIAFMVYGVTLVTSALNLTGILSTDSRVKVDILNRHYCALGVMEYVRYLTLDSQRWAGWWAAHPDGVETIYPCGVGAPEGIEIDLDGDPDSSAATNDEGLLRGSSLWPFPAYNSRRIHPL
jgi:hypothetical protein